MGDAQSLPRRALLRRGSLLVGGVLGLGLTGAASRRVTESSNHLVLRMRGTNWRLTYPNRPRGILPQTGERSAVFGELLGEGDDTKVGEFYASSFQFGSPFGVSDVAAGAMEVHQLNLADGTLVGLGTLGDLQGGLSVHAIIGGTGRYEGASGSYTARQRPFELGGDGTADFELNVMLRSA